VNSLNDFWPLAFVLGQCMSVSCGLPSGEAGALTPLNVAFMDDSPQTCGQCHTAQFEQWQGSMHSYATRDPVFMAMLRKSTADTQGELGQFCVECHAPNASKNGLTPIEENLEGQFEMLIDEDDERFTRGVQCTTCHRIEEVEATQNAKFSLSSTTLFGPTGGPDANRYHPMEKSTWLGDSVQQSFLCGSCHDVQNPKGARLEATFSEWYANEFNDPSNPSQHKSCGDCHMPAYEGTNSLGEPATQHRHTFVGVDQALVPDYPGKKVQAAMVHELLENCSELKIERSPDVNGNVAFRISVKNINNGHNLPSGSTADRQMWVHLQIRDESGALLYESGMLDVQGDLMDRVEGHSLDPFADPDLLAFGQFLLNDQDQHVNFPWQASRFDDNLIAPGQSAWREYQLPKTSVLNKTLSLNATLKYRTFPPFLLRQLAQEGWLDPTDMLEVPIIEMERAQRTFVIDTL
jgi:hypothetical protein